MKLKIITFILVAAILFQQYQIFRLSKRVELHYRAMSTMLLVDCELMALITKVPEDCKASLTKLVVKK